MVGGSDVVPPAAGDLIYLPAGSRYTGPRPMSSQTQSLHEILAKLRQDLEEFKTVAEQQGVKAVEERIEDLLEAIDAKLEWVESALKQLVNFDMVRLRVMVDVVPTEYSVMDWDIEMIETEDGKKIVREVRKARSEEAKRWLSTIKKRWEEIRRRYVIAEILPGVYLVDEQAEKELQVEWYEKVIKDLEEIERRFSVPVRTKASLRFYDIWMRRSDVIKLLREAIAALRARKQKLEEKLGEVGYYTRKKYKYMITQFEEKIRRIEEVIERLKL